MKQVVKPINIIFIILLIILAGFLIFHNLAKPVESASTDNVSGYAWSETVGWLSFNCTDRGVCGTSNYGVNMDSNGNFSGYAWSENIGWISFATSGPFPTSPNYSAKYNSDNDKVTGWARALANGGGWDGWILLGKDSGGWSNQVSINSGTGEFSGYAWGGRDTNGQAGVVGWISFKGSNYGVITLPITQPPTASNLSINPSDFCQAPAYFFSWTYSDPDGDNESRLQFQVDNNQNFNNPEIDRDITNLSNPSPSQNTQPATVAIGSYPGYLTYNRTYYWRAKVYDSQGADSGWVYGSSFVTSQHAYPSPDFDWLPNSPAPEEQVSFTDQSRCYDNNPNGSACGSNDSFAWTFQDGNPASSNDQNPTTVFASPGQKNVELRVTDSDGLSCSVVKSVRAVLPLPKWKEVKP